MCAMYVCLNVCVENVCYVCVFECMWENVCYVFMHYFKLWCVPRCLYNAGMCAEKMCVCVRVHVSISDRLKNSVDVDLSIWMCRYECVDMNVSILMCWYECVDINVLIWMCRYWCVDMNASKLMCWYERVDMNVSILMCRY